MHKQNGIILLMNHWHVIYAIEISETDKTSVSRDDKFALCITMRREQFISVDCYFQYVAALIYLIFLIWFKAEEKPFH